MSKPTIAQLKQALSLAEQIEKLETELLTLMRGGSPLASSSAAVFSAPAERGGKRKLSAATIAKMRASQQARWAKKNGSSTTTAEAPAPKGKRKRGKLSPEGRARIVAALKARHAAKKAAAK